MKKKINVIIAIVLLVFFILVGSLIGLSCRRKSNTFSAVLTFACDVQKYEQKSDKGYLTFEYEFSDKKFVKNIAINENQIKENSLQNIEDIIGITVEMNIPKEKIQTYDISSQYKDFEWILLEDGMLDDYCEIVDIFFIGESK